MLHMYIQNILIDKAEIDFSFCDTVSKREDQVNDLKYFLYKKNMDKAFISAQEPSFFIVSGSKANEIILEGCPDEELITELQKELITDFKIKSAMDRLCR